MYSIILLVTCIDIYNNYLLYVLAVSQSLVYIYTKYNFISAYDVVGRKYCHCLTNNYHVSINRCVNDCKCELL